MRISIVTLSFNQASFLKEAIDSVISQRPTDVEYVVVDPGSTDASRDIIESYGAAIDKRILEKDEGAADGLNKGFCAASGEIFGFLNADDLLAPGALAEVNAFFEKHSDCDIVCGGGAIIDVSGKRMREIRPFAVSARALCYGGADWIQQATFFRRDAYERAGGFNKANRTSWDGELLFRMLLAGARVGYSQGEWGYFRIHETSITGSGTNRLQYEQDLQRLLFDITGRPWGARDRLYRLLYRLRRLLLDPRKIVVAFGRRLSR